MFFSLLPGSGTRLTRPYLKFKCFFRAAVTACSDTLMPVYDKICYYICFVDHIRYPAATYADKTWARIVSYCFFFSSLFYFFRIAFGPFLFNCDTSEDTT